MECNKDNSTQPSSGPVSRWSRIGNSILIYASRAKKIGSGLLTKSASCFGAITRKLVNPKEADFFALRILRLGGSLSIFFVALIILMGLVRLSLGSLQFVGFAVENCENAIFSFKISSITPDSHQAISTLVGSLEYFLLAPLCYLQLRTLGDYVEGFLGIHPPDNSSGTKYDAKHGLLTVKALSVGLLITILATHGVGEFLKPIEHGIHSPESAKGEQPFNWIKIASISGFLLVLTAYFFVIESTVSRRKSNN